MSETFLTYKHATNTIKLLYKQQGFTINGATLGEIIYDEFKIDVKNSKIAPLFAFVDEYIILLKVISSYYLKGAIEKHKHSITYYKIIIRQIKHLSSIRLLCSFGLDTDARTLLRLLYETSLVWSRCKLDINFLEEYNNNFGTKESNEFWHKYIKSSKTEKFIIDEVSKRNLTWLGNLDDQLTHMKSIFSLTSHPNNHIDHLSIKSDIKSESIGLEPISDNSQLTLTYAILCTVLPFSILPDPEELFKIEGNFVDMPFLPSNAKINSLFEYHSAIKNMIPVLFLMSTRFSDELNSNI